MNYYFIVLIIIDYFNNIHYIHLLNPQIIKLILIIFILILISIFIMLIIMLHIVFINLLIIILIYLYLFLNFINPFNFIKDHFLIIQLMNINHFL